MSGHSECVRVRVSGQVRTIRLILVLLVGLAWAGAARADLAAQSAPLPAEQKPALSDSNCETPVAASDSAGRPLSTSDLLGDQPWANLPAAPVAETDGAAVRQLPALPSSASLFLSAVLSVGAWHTMRKASHLHLANLPEWYHAGAPDQVGHAVVFDPTLSFELLPVCLFDVPLGIEPARFPHTPRELPSRYESQHTLTIESPRAPPSVA